MRRAFAVSLACLALALALEFSAPPDAFAQVTTDVEGRVVNGTDGAETPFALTVTLSVFRLGDLQETRETVTDTGGGFAFSDVRGGEGHGYIISADYGGIVYTYERDYPLPTEPVTLMVYENTDSRDSIAVSSHSLVVGGIDPDSQTIEILELVGLENSGDRSFLADLSQAQAGQMAFLRFSLPTTVTDLDVQSSMRGGTILQVDRGFAMTTPVKPGEHEIAYSFRTTYSAAGSRSITDCRSARTTSACSCPRAWAAYRAKSCRRWSLSRWAKGRTSDLKGRTCRPGLAWCSISPTCPSRPCWPACAPPPRTTRSCWYRSPSLLARGYWRCWDT